MRSYERGELAKSILLIIAGGSAALGLAFILSALPGLAYISKLFDAKNNGEKTRIRQSIKGLERHGYIEFLKKDGEEYLKITPLGKIVAKQYAVIQTRPMKPKMWDGLWRLVMFDIPENKRSARDALRFALRKMGLLQIQKSVFIYPYPCEKEVDFVAKYFQIRKGILYATTNNIEGTRSIRKKFNI